MGVEILHKGEVNDVSGKWIEDILFAGNHFAVGSILSSLPFLSFLSSFFLGNYTNMMTLL